MAGNLPRLLPTSDPADRVEVQETAFSIDVPARYVCSTWDEAINNGGVQFDVVVIGAGMFGAYCAEKIYRNSNLRVLVLEAGSFLVSEHVQNLARIGLNVAGAIRVPGNADDPGTRERGAARLHSPGWPTALVDVRCTGAVGPRVSRRRISPSTGHRNYRRSCRAQTTKTMSIG
jgi:hypothetical protein